MMKAVLLDKDNVGHNALQALRVGEIAKPVPKSNQVVVKVTHTAINPVDWKMAEYNFLIKAFPVVLGCDVAGIVDSVGDGVHNVKPGDKVWGFTDLGTQHGTFSEYALLDHEFLGPIPAGISEAAASTLAVGALTACLGLFQGGDVPLPSQGGDKAKRTVVIWGAAGSVGSYAVQLAAAAGLSVIGVCSAKSSERVKKLGAHVTVDYNSPTVVEDLRRAAGGQPLTLGFDAVGSESATKLAQALSPDAPATLLFIAGAPDASQVPANVTVKSILLGDAYHAPAKRAVIGDYVREVNSLIEAGRLEANEIYDGGHGLEAVAGALRAQKDGSSGSKKVVVTLA